MDLQAIFSMVFFNSASDSNGRANVTVSPQWWYFIAITVPLTIVVFSVWVLWKRWRDNVQEINNEDVAEAKV